jgi:hypothetical protein
MKKLLFAFGIVAFSSGIAIGTYFFNLPSPQTLEAKPSPQANPQTKNATNSNKALLPTTDSEDKSDDRRDEISVEKSDALIEEAIKKIMSKDEILAHFQIEDFIHKIVNCRRIKNVIRKYLPLLIHLKKQKI